MKTKTISLLYFFCITCFAVKAQVVLPEISSNYSSSVCVKLYEIATTINVPDKQQVTLAKLLAREDSLLASLIKKKRSLDEINEAKLALQIELQEILGAKKWNQLQTTRSSGKAQKEGEAMKRLFENKYNCDSTIASIAGDLFYKRSQALDRVYNVKKFNDSALENSFDAIVSLYDSAIQKYNTTISGSVYIKEKIALLNNIKPLSIQNQADLKNRFLTLSIKNDKSYADNFWESLRKVTNDTIYFAGLFKEEVNKEAIGNARIEINAYHRKQKLSKNGETALMPVIIEKERKLAIVNRTFPTYSKTKDSFVTAIHQLYDSLIESTLVKAGSGSSSSQFSIAVKYREALGLTDIQVDSLLGKAAQLKLMKDTFVRSDPYASFDSKAFETENMLKILSEDQYTKVLVVKNKSKSKSDSQKDWDEIVQRKMEGSYNKETSIKQMENYYLAKWIAYYRYGNDRVKQSANVKNIQDHMPSILKALNAARKYNNPVDNTAQESYKW